MPRTIKVSGFSDELLSLVERRWPRHYGDRSEYIRDLIRKDVLADARDRRKAAADPTAGFAVVRDNKPPAFEIPTEASTPVPIDLSTYQPADLSISQAVLQAVASKSRPKRTPRRRSLPMLG